MFSLIQSQIACTLFCNTVVIKGVPIPLFTDTSNTSVCGKDIGRYRYYKLKLKFIERSASVLNIILLQTHKLTLL